MSRRPRGKSRGGSRGRKPERPNIPDQTVEIASLGAKGDGEGLLANGAKVFVPMTVPGDLAQVHVTHKRGDGFAAEVVEFDREGSKRPADCAYYGHCGGCQVQHVPDDIYAAWKRETVVLALARHGIETEVDPVMQVPFGARRRLTFKCRLTASGCVLGFNTAMSDRIVDVVTCPAISGELRGIGDTLRGLMPSILRDGGGAEVMLSQLPKSGIDVIIVNGEVPTLEAREAIAAFADRHDLARVGWDDMRGDVEPIVVRRDFVAEMGGIDVPLPWGCFLQPSTEGEQFLQKTVLAHLEGARSAVDLFSGVGTFTFPLATAGAKVHAVDGEVKQTGAITLAAGRAGLGGKVAAAPRDLFRKPLMANELADFDAAVFDPPRAGAKEQSTCLAESGIQRIAAVSCNPATLARDLRILVDGGFALERVIPLDQFPMTHHVEAVALLSR